MQGTPISKDGVFARPLGALMNVELWLRHGRRAHSVVVDRLELSVHGARLRSATTGREYELVRMSGPGWYLYEFGNAGTTQRLYIGDTLTVTPEYQRPEPPPHRRRLVAARRPRRLTDLGLSYEVGTSPSEYNERIRARYRALPWWRRAIIAANMLLRGRI